MEEDINMFIGRNKTVAIPPASADIFTKASSNELPSDKVLPRIKQFLNFLINIQKHLKRPYYRYEFITKNNKSPQTLNLCFKTYDCLFLSNCT